MKVYCASASGFRCDFDWQLNEHVTMRNDHSYFTYYTCHLLCLEAQHGTGVSGHFMGSYMNYWPCFESFALRTVELIFLCFIALIQLSRLLDIYRVRSCWHSKLPPSWRSIEHKRYAAVYALKILCSEYDVCRKNLYDFLVQSYNNRAELSW